MRYTFLSVHAVRGLTRNFGAPDTVLFDDPAGGVRVTLSANVDAHLTLLTKQQALISMMVRGMFDNRPAEILEDLLAKEIGGIEKQRLAAIAGDSVVIIELGGDTVAAIPEAAKSIGGCVLCFDAYDKLALHAQLQPKVAAVLTALRLGADHHYRYRPISDGSYLTEGGGRTVFSAAMRFFAAEVTAAKDLSVERHARIGADIRLVLGAGDLQRVIGLHARSLNKNMDNYRSFLASWSALEILVGKLFPIYQHHLDDELRSVGHTPGFLSYLERIADVMRGRHSLVDRFSVLSIYLDDEQRLDEVTRFRALKKVRDQISHGEETPDDDLPTGEVQQLFDKYLRNHLRRAT